MNIKKLLTIFITLAITSYGATFNVSTTPELRIALSTAATNGEDDTIILADGTYKTTDDGQGTFIYLSNEANILTLQGSSSKNAIISGDHQYQVFKHTSTELNAALYMKKVSIIDGNTTELGGGIKASDTIYISDSNISNNTTTYEGGGLFTGKSIIVDNSFFSNNKASSGGAFRSGEYTEIKNSILLNNTANVYGGGFYQFNGNTLVENSIFKNNSARDGGGFLAPYNTQRIDIKKSIFIDNQSNSDWGSAIGLFNGSGKLYIQNSIFKGNGDTNTVHTVINASYSEILNSLFINNSKLYISSNSKVINTIIQNTIIDGYTTSLVSIYNCYVNENDIKNDKLTNNNIFYNITLGFVDEVNGDYRLTSSSNLIDAGTTDIDGITFPTTDFDGNLRIVGGSIDIGPYEFTTTKPTINSITYSGEAKEQAQLTFTTNYTLASGRSISKVEYDYSNDGTWTTLDTHTFNTKGTYTIEVKITDNTGEFSKTTKTVTIVELPFNEMTDAQKLVKAIDPQYYESILAIIKSEKDSANASGVTVGENNVMLNPTAYNLVPKSSLAVSSDEIASLPTGFSLIGTKETITDLSIFNSAKIIWIYNSTTAKWSAWSSDATTMSKISSSSDVGTITTIPANSGIWVNK